MSLNSKVTSPHASNSIKWFNIFAQKNLWSSIEIIKKLHSQVISDKMKDTAKDDHLNLDGDWTVFYPHS